MKLQALDLPAKILLLGLIWVLWEMGARYVHNEVILPLPENVLAILLSPGQQIFASGSLMTNLGISIIRVVTGFCLAVLVALPLGIMMDQWKTVRSLVEPLVEMVRPIPPLAWVPLILAWFGIKNMADLLGLPKGSFWFANLQISMILIIFLGAFFPVLLNTIHGLLTVPRVLIDSALTLGASKRDILFKVKIPTALPSILTGCRVGLGVAWMCVVSAEMMPGSITGIGYAIWLARELLRTDIIVAGMVLIGAVGTLLDLGLRSLSRKSLRWS